MTQPKKKIKRIAKQRMVVLPKDTLAKIEALELPKIERDYAIKFVSNLMKRSLRAYWTINALVDTPKSYIEKATNFRYYIWLDKLLEANVVYTDHSYSNGDANFCKAYCVVTNADFNKDLSQKKNFKLGDYVNVAYSTKEDKLTDNETKFRDMVIKDLKSLKFDSAPMYKILQDLIDEVKIENYPTMEAIDKDVLEVFLTEKGKKKKIWMKKETAISRANEYKTLLIQDEKVCYLMSEEDFIEMKKEALAVSYKGVINNFEKKYFQASRNNTNHRLDTNLTSMANTLSDELMKQNDLIQFDMANSQFALLAHVLEGQLDTEDYYRFKEQANEGTLYEYIQKELGLTTRKKAKNVMFELMFSKENLCTPQKKQLKTLFPSVVELVDNYKREHGYNKFSIMLQKRESELFIDGLLLTIKKKHKIFCLTKHDALIFRKQDEEIATKIITEYFKSVDFKGKIIKG